MTTNPIPAPPIELAAGNHPDPRVRGAGFDLNHPYLEDCWAPIIGPSAVTFLRRLPVLWQHAEPAVINADDLARSLGLGPAGGRWSRFHRAVERIVGFGLAEWTEPDRALTVYQELSPLAEHQLAKLPDWSRRAHDTLLAAHIDRLAQPYRTADATTPAPTPVTHLTTRLDRLPRPSGPATGTLGR
jgi:hypothetical protein